jgi:hypothetical protein
LGEWDGPIYGELGVLASDGDTIQCHCCGEWFRGLNHHVWAAHDLLAREYKATFGLNISTPLVAPDISEKLRQNGHRLQELMGPNIDRLTPEQHSAVSSRRRSVQFTMQQSERFIGRPRRSPGSASGYRGVVQQSPNAWSAIVTYRREKHYAGCFDTPEEAARAYDAKARELYGDAARLNFPDDQAP